MAEEIVSLKIDDDETEGCLCRDAEEGSKVELQPEEITIDEDLPAAEGGVE